MIRLTGILTAVLLLVAAGHSVAEEAMRTEVTVHQTDPRTDEPVLLYSDTVDIVQGTPLTGFPLAFSFLVEVNALDSAGADFSVHVVTLGAQPQNTSRSFRTDYDLPAKIEPILGKEDARYMLTLRPLRRVELDLSSCAFGHQEKGAFKIGPSAYINLHYVQSTYGDLYLNLVKGIQDQHFREFRKMMNFTLPGRYSLFLCPCALPSVLWDRRFGMMVDPTRTSAFVIYGPTANTAYPFAVMQTALFHNYGYAPPFVSEGLSGYFSFPHFGMNELRAAGRELPLDSLMNTYYFFTADPEVADRTAASLARYLVDRYGLDRFMNLYRRADDLSLQSVLEDEYSKSLSDLEVEWHAFLDTLSYSSEELAAHAGQAEAMFDYSLMQRYATAMLDQAASARDSVFAVSNLVRADFFLGDYSAAAGLQAEIVKRDSITARSPMAMANYQMMSGLYDSARENLMLALERDTANGLVKFNLALNALAQGDSSKAVEYLQEVVAGSGAGGSAESRIMLGHLLNAIGGDAEHKRAQELFYQAINLIGQSIQEHNGNPSQFMWIGIAYVGLGNTADAHEYLQTARYLEQRAFYRGLIDLWLGRLADLRNERPAAEEFYSRLIKNPSAEYHKDAARRLLEVPYRQ